VSITPCNKCDFWVPASALYVERTGRDIGTCHRRAPVVVTVSDGESSGPETEWPETYRELDFCGEGEVKRGPEA